MITGYLTEKHTQASVLARALGGKPSAAEKSAGFYRIGDTIITWAAGHLFRLFSPEEYDPALKTWSFDSLPFPFRDFRYCVDAESSNGALKARQFRIITDLCKQVDRWIIATDDDREGEVIGRQALEFAGWKRNIGRLIFSAVDERTFRKALGAEKQASAFDGRYREGLTRGIADFVIGLEITRASHLAFSQGDRRSIVVSGGRVQSPVLSLIEDRCASIRNFKPEEYYEPALVCSVGSGTVELIHSPDPKIFDRSLADRIGASVPDRISLEVLTKPGRKAPPRLYNSSSLFGDAADQFSWESAHTLAVANRLYLDGHILYPRSDCEFLPESMATEAGLLLDRLGQVEEICPEGTAGILDAGFRVRDDIYNDRKITAHTAIIPNVNRLKSTNLDLSAFDPDEKQLFIMIARRFLVSHLPDEEFLQTNVSWTAPGGEIFRTTGKVVTKPGWRFFYQAADEDEEAGSENVNIVLPIELQDGLAVHVDDFSIKRKMTRAAPWFTEKSLQAALEKYGFGTPSTFAEHIKGLRARLYIAGSVKKIEITDRGSEIVKGWRKTVPELLSPKMTAYIESRLREIEQGKTGMADVIAEIRQLSARWVEALRQAPPDLVDISRISISRPPTLKQKAMVRRAAEMLGIPVSKEILQDRDACSDFLEQHREKLDEAFRVPSGEMIALARAITNGNPELELSEELLSSREALSEFINRHREHAVFKPSDKQLELVRKRAGQLGIAVPQNVLSDARRLSVWIEEHPVPPSSKQLQLAQKLALASKIELPQDCKFNATRCSAFIQKHFVARERKKAK